MTNNKYSVILEEREVVYETISYIYLYRARNHWLIFHL